MPTAVRASTVSARTPREANSGACSETGALAASSSAASTSGAPVVEWSSALAVAVLWLDTLLLGAIVLISGRTSGISNVADVEWYYLLGGALGAAYVFSALVLVSHIGAGGVAAATVTGQLTTSVILDRIGFLGLSEEPFSAPRVIGDLLIALRKAGATVISPPACAGCGKELRTMQRRWQDWYCGGCGPQRERCGGCGNTRPVTFRDRDGQPRCDQCPPGDGRDHASRCS